MRPVLSVLGLVGGLLSLAVGCAAPTTPDGPPPLQGAVVIVLDTLRADRLGCYGHDRPTSPNLDALAAAGVRFDQAVSPSPWTLPSIAALLGGDQAERVIPPGGVMERSIVSDLRGAGVTTAAFTEGGYVSRSFGFDLGFLTWQEEEGPVQLLTPGQSTNPVAAGGIERTFSRASAWLAERGDEPFFLLVHTYEPHTPYVRPEFAEGLDSGGLGPTLPIESLEKFRSGEIGVDDRVREYVGALYDGGVRHADRQVGELLATLETAGLAGRTLVIVTSDHGEELGDRHPTRIADHGHGLDDGQLRVPLIVRDPGIEASGGVVEDQVRLIDVLPTVADRLGLEPEHPGGGRSLLPLMLGDERGADDRLALLGNTKAGPPRAGVRALGFKYVVTLGPDPFEVPLQPAPAGRQLYDLAEDPGERRNLIDTRPELAAELDRLLREQLGQLRRSGRLDQELPDEIDDQLMERLRSLGYVR